MRYNGASIIRWFIGRITRAIGTKWWLTKLRSPGLVMMYGINSFANVLMDSTYLSPPFTLPSGFQECCTSQSISLITHPHSPLPFPFSNASTILLSTRPCAASYAFQHQPPIYKHANIPSLTGDEFRNDPRNPNAKTQKPADKR